MKKNPKREQPVKPVSYGRFCVNINGHSLSCVKGTGPWVFICFEWPDLVRKHAGSESAEGIVREFTERALALAVVAGGG